MKQLSTIIRNFSYRGRKFAIVKHEGFYCAIDFQYIDEEGRITKQLHGGQMFAARELSECIKNIQTQLDIRYYMDNGMSRSEAFCKAFGLDMTPEIEALFA